MGLARFSLPHGGSYEEICARFRWSIPERFNIGVAVCDDHADGAGRPALIYDDLDRPAVAYSFDQLKALSNQAANMLAAYGVGPGDRVGILLPQRPETVHMLRYWNDDAATAAKHAGGWLLTGDVGTQDADGYFWYEGRDDDIISSGYRIGPTDIEDCIIRHPGVLMVAVVGSPDPVRGEVVKAFVQLRDGVVPSERLAEEIKAFVREKLAAYQYSRDVEFVDELPTTATGKLRRNVLRELERSRKSAAA